MPMATPRSVRRIRETQAPHHLLRYAFRFAALNAQTFAHCSVVCAFGRRAFTVSLDDLSQACCWVLLWWRGNCDFFRNIGFGLDWRIGIPRGPLGGPAGGSARSSVQ